MDNKPNISDTPITPVIKGRSPNKEEIFINEKYLESISKQPELMDSVAKQLLTLELAIPGIYASVLKLVSSGEKPLSLSTDLYFVFACWLVSLICIIMAIIPRTYKADLNDKTAIRKSFFEAALYKFTWILASVATFVAGLFFAIKDLIT